MTFLNPIALFGLAAAAIPILLHLLSLRKLRTVEFSTLSFLKELQKTRIRRIKIRQILLLILRTLLILLLVIAFSRPTLRGTFSAGLGQRAASSAVILVDNSPSMEAQDEHGDVFRQARESALAILDGLEEGDEATVLGFSETRSGHPDLMPIPSRNLPMLRSIVRDLKISPLTSTLERALSLAGHQLRRSRNYNKELYIISDFQSGLAAKKETATADGMFPVGVNTFLVRLGNPPPANIAVTNVRVESAVIERGRPFLLKATIANYTDQSIRDHVASVVLNGTRVAQKSLDIPSGGSIEADFSIVPQNAGTVSGFVELENDDLEFDNRRYFSVHIPERLHVLMIGAPADLRFARLALEARLSDSTAVVDVVTATPDRLSSNLIASADAIFLVNTVALNPGQVDRLRIFLDAGGGLMLFAGSGVVPSAYQSVLAGPLRLPPLATPDAAGRTGEIGIESSDLRHPLFQRMFEDAASRSDRGTNRRLESPTIRTVARFLPTERSTVIVSLTNGAPFLLEQRAGSGTVLLSSVPPTSDWSDLPTTGLFVPLLHRAASYLARRQSIQPSVTAGDPVTLPTGRVSSARYVVSAPGQREFYVTPERGRERSILIDATEFPGPYLVRSGNDPFGGFTVNIDPAESRTPRLQAAALTKLWNAAGLDGRRVTSLEHAQDVHRAVKETRYGAELWRWFMVAALLMALLEMWVARETRRTTAEVLTPGPAQDQPMTRTTT